MTADVEIRADVAVLGGGTAGALVAGKIIQDSAASVVVLEAGPDYGAFAEGAWPVELLNADTLPTTHDWGYSGPGPSRAPLGFERAKVVGGCSAHNGCSQSIGVRTDYDDLGMAWRAGELDDRSWDLASALRLKSPGGEELTPFQAAALEGLVETGTPCTDDFLDPDGGIGCGAAPVSAPDGIRWNSAFAFLDPVRPSKRLRILDLCEVDRLEVKSGRIRRALVERRGTRLHVVAEQFVLSAGAYGSPAVLLRSGVGPPEHLRTLGITVTVPLQGVGANLHDHPTCELRFAASDELIQATAVYARHHRVPDEQVIAKTASGLGPLPYDMHIFPYTDGSGDGLEIVLPVGLLAPISRGRLHLRSADFREPPHIVHGYLSDEAEHDVRALKAGLHQLEALAAAPPLRHLLGERLPEPTGAPARLGHYWHPVGTCAMRPVEERGVVDTHGKVHGLDNLRVIDASIFPAVPRATTNFPVLLVADRLADHLVAKPFHAAQD